MAVTVASSSGIRSAIVEAFTPTSRPPIGTTDSRSRSFGNSSAGIAAFRPATTSRYQRRTRSATPGEGAIETGAT
jgi:hypothetical protein